MTIRRGTASDSPPPICRSPLPVAQSPLPNRCSPLPKVQSPLPVCYLQGTADCWQRTARLRGATAHYESPQHRTPNTNQRKRPRFRHDESVSRRTSAPLASVERGDGSGNRGFALFLQTQCRRYQRVVAASAHEGRAIEMEAGDVHRAGRGYRFYAASFQCAFKSSRNGCKSRAASSVS